MPQKLDIVVPPEAQGASKTTGYVIEGQHTHKITRYSLNRGYGDGYAIASKTFTVGGYEWVLLFYPEGTRDNPSYLSRGLCHPKEQQQAAAAAAAANPGLAAGEGDAEDHCSDLDTEEAAPAAATAAAADAKNAKENKFAAIYLAMVGRRFYAQGGTPNLPWLPPNLHARKEHVVRLFHTFTLVNQLSGDRSKDVSKGRTRGRENALDISCDYLNPKARSYHGYRKFLERSVLEDPNRGFLVNDSLVIRYSMQLVVMPHPNDCRPEPISVPPSDLHKDMATLLVSGRDTDFTIVCEGEEFKVHSLLLCARCPYFSAMLSSGMTEANDGRCIESLCKPDVFRTVIHYIYTGQLPEGLLESLVESDSGMYRAQQLLEAADSYELPGLVALCEQVLCQRVTLASACTMLQLADRHSAQELKLVCMDLLTRRLPEIMDTDEYLHMGTACPHLQTELLLSCT